MSSMTNQSASSEDQYRGDPWPLLPGQGEAWDGRILKGSCPLASSLNVSSLQEEVERELGVSVVDICHVYKGANSYVSPFQASICACSELQKPAPITV